MDTDISWPPAFTLRKHPRARHVKLKASFKKGLELVVPMRFNQKHIPDILETNRLWIIQQLKKLQEGSAQVDILPDGIHFPAIDEQWKIFYTQGNSEKIRLLVRPNNEIALYGNISNVSLCKKALALWVKSHAKKTLPQQLARLSETTLLTYKKVTIRDQQTRWGSCSSDNCINLNYKLLFLPPEIMMHILIHELCHTVHLNHSAKFWRLVASFDTQWKKHTVESRRADQYIPQWCR